jgi:hypothetical protein
MGTDFKGSCKPSIIFIFLILCLLDVKDSANLNKFFNLTIGNLKEIK